MHSDWSMKILLTVQKEPERKFNDLPYVLLWPTCKEESCGEQRGGELIEKIPAQI